VEKRGIFFASAGQSNRNHRTNTPKCNPEKRIPQPGGNQNLE
jgi:hypothetical protein